MDPGAGIVNYKVYMTRSEFEDELSELGWAKEPSDDGKAMNYMKDGAKYSVRDDAKSTGEPTADFFHPLGKKAKNKSGLDMNSGLGANK